MNYREQFEKENNNISAINDFGGHKEIYVEWLEQRLEKAEDATRWRDVKNELPKINEYVLIKKRNDIYCAKLRDDDKWQDRDGYFINETDFEWLPIPEWRQ